VLRRFLQRFPQSYRALRYILWSGRFLQQARQSYLEQWRLDQPRLTRQPAAVRFQAEHSNDCWQFDISPSDLKQVEAPLWIEPGRGAPTRTRWPLLSKGRRLENGRRLGTRTPGAGGRGRTGVAAIARGSEESENARAV
jgi:hypothetical protein